MQAIFPILNQPWLKKGGVYELSRIIALAYKHLNHIIAFSRHFYGGCLQLDDASPKWNSVVKVKSTKLKFESTAEKALRRLQTLCKMWFMYNWQSGRGIFYSVCFKCYSSILCCSWPQTVTTLWGPTLALSFHLLPRPITSEAGCWLSPLTSRCSAVARHHLSQTASLTQPVKMELWKSHIIQAGKTMRDPLLSISVMSSE